METKDLIVIGGGINGAGIAADAAGRGLSVLMLEARDLACATSVSYTHLDVYKRQASEAMVQKRQYASLSSLFAQLFIELADWQRPLYLVIDDYHLINNPVIHDAMRFFLRHQPENMTLVVLSRNLPQLGIANLRVRDQLLEIGSQQLAFTHQEAKQFFDCRLTSPIEADDSSRLCDDVAGWATALQLIALSARQNNSSAQHSARRLAGINAVSYTHLDVYKRQPYKNRRRCCVTC